MENEIIEIILRVIHLVRTQKFPKNWHFLPADTHKKVRNNSFLENFTYVLNKCFLGVFTWTLSTKSDLESVLLLLLLLLLFYCFLALLVLLCIFMLVLLFTINFYQPVSTFHWESEWPFIEWPRWIWSFKGTLIFKISKKFGRL